MAITTNTLIQAEEITNGGILRTGPQNQQLNPDLLAPNIWIAEQTHVLDVLGSQLYEDLITQKGGLISNYNDLCGCPLQNAFPDNACYESFWTAILKRFCSIATIYESLPFLTIEIANNGLLLNDTNYAQPAGVEGLRVMQTTLRKQLTTLRELTEKYICENKDCLSLGCCPTCRYDWDHCSCDNCDTKAPKSKLMLFSPSKKRKDRYYNDRHYKNNCW
jgi:hypothetical protein